ncbi:MAG: serine hydroxymethyltransferase, partial [Acetobacter sp.]|nr:serine hydroxymethyltransferase [Acetobacter sp.]
MSTDILKNFFQSSLASVDAEVASAIASEFERQRDGIELIASENMVSEAVL